MDTSDPSSDDLDEPIHLLAWDPSWPAMAGMLEAELVPQIPLSSLIEPIGSTAVEGMRAKPVIDLMIGAAGYADVEVIAQRLARGGWQDMGEAGVAGRRHLRRRRGAPVNVHIVGLASEHWRNNLAIRDYLRAHPAARSAYSALKQSIIAEGADLLLAYSDRKAAFMAELLERALAWKNGQRP